MTTYAAHDLRFTLAISFQPAITQSGDLVSQVIANLATDFAAAGVTERRVRNAVAKMDFDPAHLERLVKALNAATALRDSRSGRGPSF